MVRRPGGGCGIAAGVSHPGRSAQVESGLVAHHRHLPKQSPYHGIRPLNRRWLSISLVAFPPAKTAPIVANATTHAMGTGGRSSGNRLCYSDKALHAALLVGWLAICIEVRDFIEPMRA